MYNTYTQKPAEILLVEDNPGDARLVREALKESRVPNNLHRVEDGQAAMTFLRGQNHYHNAPRPNLILLDLNLPKKDGREVLAEIKQDPLLKRIPVVVFTTSEAEQDIAKTYQLHANCYITKPVDLDRFMQVIQSIANFWLNVAKLPVNSAT